MSVKPQVSKQTLSRPWILMGIMLILSIPGIVMRLSGAHVPPLTEALIAGISLISAAFLLAWAAEAAETVIAGGLAIAILALITVLPEYAVDIVLAWNGAHNQEEAHLAVANMTGANRLLIGIGWTGAVFLAAGITWRKRGWKNAQKGLPLPAHSIVELVLLLVATVYALSLPWKGSITIFDTVILFSIYIFYLWFLSRGGSDATPDDLIGPPHEIAKLDPQWRNLTIIGLFVLSAITIFCVAEPFTQGLINVGNDLHIDKFVLISIVAPLASEAPELIIVALFVIAGRGEKSLQALVSSKVNQWTLLVGSIPLVYSLASGFNRDFLLDDRQKEELLLTSAQCILAVILVLDRELGFFDSIALFCLYAFQYAFPLTEARYIFAYLYILLAFGAIVFLPKVRRGIGRVPRSFKSQMVYAWNANRGEEDKK
jgi:cation:H+ antiporter